MVNYFIYATDDSMSTRGAEYFNRKGLETLQKFKDEVKDLQNNSGGSVEDDRVVYLHWSHRCEPIEEGKVELRYREKNGNGYNTLPHTVLDWMAQNLKENDTVQLLYVITDGAVYSANIRPIDPNMKIDNVVFYAFNSDINRIDMSVASMFICNNKRYIVHCNEELVDDTDLSNPFDYDQITVKTFHEKKEALKSYIKLQFLNKSSSDRMALEEIKKIKRLRTRLYAELEAEEKLNPEASLNLNVKDKDSFVQQFKRTTFYATIMNSDHHNQKQVIESCISALISYINNDKKSFNFDNLKFTQKFTPAPEEEDVSNVGYDSAEEISFPDIIMSNETGIPVILLTHYSLIDKILFKSDEDQTSHSAHFSRFRSMIECPLMLLNDVNFKSSIEYFYNLEAFKNMIEHGILTGPRTREPFTGAIVPLEEFDDYNDYILSCTYFAGRRVPYNQGLLYYVLYKTCEKLEYIEPNVVKYLKGYVIKRIAKTQCYLGLSGVSIDDPLIKVNLTTALWYCVELSSIIFGNDPTHFTKEKLRMYSHFVEYMKEILEWFQYQIDTNLVNRRADIFKHLNQLKRIPRFEDKAMFILEQIFLKKDGFLVSEIVNPDNIYKLLYIKMDHRKLVDESVLSVEVDVHKFAHFMDYIEDTNVPICRKTLRPHFVTEDNKSFYEQVKMKAKKVLVQNGRLTLEPVSKLSLSRILSLNKLYILYVEEHSKYPTLEEYKQFVLKKKLVFRSKPVIFTTGVVSYIKGVHQDYEKIINDKNDPISVSEFIEITKESVNREKRIRLEEPTAFDMSEILEYIKKSESNVEFDS
ncbi:unnamed protein product [Arctia plantaginis]|uniref:P94 n=1 Tax=Arctia plantaginis TaxID=874455 RepID=A0A8S1AIZ9_ARCPL|nr:unnamed protein product [Arctia plantaginis]